jgi:hypothetical protein
MASAAETAAIAALNEATALLKSQALKPRAGAAEVAGNLAAPHVTTGPVYQDSQGFLLTKAIGASRGFIPRDQAKGELDACEKFEKALRETRTGAEQPRAGVAHDPAGHGPPARRDRGPRGRRVMKACGRAGTASYDPDEAAWLARV